jgi:hypothetical protein
VKGVGVGIVRRGGRNTRGEGLHVGRHGMCRQGITWESECGRRSLAEVLCLNRRSRLSEDSIAHDDEC